MKRTMKSVLGVTLLEIMLVLAIAAMIIVMSVRYYQSASAGQQANGALSMIQAITAAADSLAQNSGAYNNVTSPVSLANIQALLPNNSVTLPWGGTATFANITATTYKVNFLVTPAAVCQKLASGLAGNTKYTLVTASAACGTTVPVTFTYTYNSNL